jgi:hypothetical protein
MKEGYVCAEVIKPETGNLNSKTVHHSGTFSKETAALLNAQALHLDSLEVSSVLLLRVQYSPKTSLPTGTTNGTGRMASLRGIRFLRPGSEETAA